MGASFAQLLDTTGLGIVQLDGRGRIAAANDRARDMLRGGDGLFDEDGFLCARRPEDNANSRVCWRGGCCRLGLKAPAAR